MQYLRGKCLRIFKSKQTKLTIESVVQLIAILFVGHLELYMVKIKGIYISVFYNFNCLLGYSFVCKFDLGFFKIIYLIFFKNVQVHDFSVGKEYFNIFFGDGAFWHITILIH